MLIDWFTVGAQVLNFLILVWLLKRFLYKPILDAIDAREKRIAGELADADRKKAEAEREHEEFLRRNSDLDQQRAAILSQAADQARAEGLRLLDETRQAADALRMKLQEALDREQQSLNQQLAQRTREEVFSIARKTLADLAGVTLEERISEMLANRLRGLNKEARQSLAAALTTSAGPAVLRSAFGLSSEQRAAIQSALNETLLTEIQLRFELAPNLVGGIELIGDGQKVAWSIRDYLTSMERSVGELVQQRSLSIARHEPNSGSGPDAAELQVGK